MQKVGVKAAKTAPLQIGEDTIALYASVFTDHRQPERQEMAAMIENYRGSLNYQDTRIARWEAEIEDAKRERESIEEEIGSMQKNLDALPVVTRVTNEEARAQIEAALALPFVKSVEEEVINRVQQLVVTTRPDSLFTTLNKKLSRTGRWYRVKPYRIPLPAYKIRFALRSFNTLSNADGNLAMKLADPNRDTSRFVGGPWYVPQTNAHWACVNTRAWSRVCLGEYESDVSRAFRVSLADGLQQLAIFLQMAGATNGYVRSREKWALWLGKPEHSGLIMPSSVSDVDDSKEVDEDADENNDDDDQEHDDHESCEDCGNCLGCGDCTC